MNREYEVYWSRRYAISNRKQLSIAMCCGFTTLLVFSVVISNNVGSFVKSFDKTFTWQSRIIPRTETGNHRTLDKISNFTPSLIRRKDYKNDYINIPVEYIQSTYGSTDNWTDKLQTRIKEKIEWEKAWATFSRTPSRHESISLQNVAQAIADYEQFSKKVEKPKHSHFQSEGPTLIIYNYYEAPLNHKNAAFFFRHHKPEWADVLLVVNGKTHSLELPSWVKVVQRENFGLEFCAMMEILPTLLYGKSLNQNEQLLALWRNKYSYFVLLNASVRGPFYPLWPWEDSNWVKVFKDQLTEETWLVGTSFNCMKNEPSLYHLQSFTLMTHRRGLEMIYEDFQYRQLIFKASNQSCDARDTFNEPGKQAVIFVYEIGMTQTFLSRNIGVKSLALGWQGIDFRFPEGVNMMCMKRHDQYFPKWYFGIDYNPFEVIFQKTNTASFKRVDMAMLDIYTLWFDQRVDNNLD